MKESLFMNELIAYCGLDCAKCEAYLATINNDDELRIKVAKLWSELNNVTITKEMINCLGCKQDGVKTPFCELLCPIRQCALKKSINTCRVCDNKKTCPKLQMIIATSKEARERILS